MAWWPCLHGEGAGVEVGKRDIVQAAHVLERNFKRERSETEHFQVSGQDARVALTMLLQLVLAI